jgi:sugar lactone lactonase YvrE
MNKHGVLPFVLLSGLVSAAAIADDDARFPKPASFTTFAVTPFAIEGLTGDDAGNLYTTGRQLNTAKRCPVWRFDSNGARVTVGFIANTPACNPSGITFDSLGNLYIADAARGGVIWRVTPHPVGCASDDSDSALCAGVPSVTVPFASAVPGSNGVAFDGDGNLWTGDGTTGEGRVWRITGDGAACALATPVRCTEVFRIQPMANDVNRVTNADGTVTGGVGRDARTLPPGTIFFVPPTGVAVRSASNTAGSQPLVANGVAFNREGDLFIADTARGALWKAELDRRGELKSKTGCDSTFTANTLCLDNVYVAHPYLEGTDGIALDRAGNIWNSANERNAIIVVTRQRDVVEVFRNPANASGLRNAADPTFGNNHILEFPTSPFLSGRRFCTSNSDGDRRDNSPRTAGEINGGAGDARGKISCMDQDLIIPGLPLPVR